MEVSGQCDGDVQCVKVDSQKSSYDESELDQKECKDPPISYIESLMHLLKAYVGTGCFAMAHATKNGGLILGPILTLFLGIICLHASHILVQCSTKVKIKFRMKSSPDYAETVELCFLSSDKEIWRKLAQTMKTTCNVFICITQLGFCCVYLLFIGTSMNQVLEYYGVHLSVSALVAVGLIPVWLSALITNLKYLGERHLNFYCSMSSLKIFRSVPCSSVAVLCMITGIVITYYYILQDLPDITDRNFMPPSIHSLPLFFGTTLFAFEGVAVVLPLKSTMKQPRNLSRKLGVLNVGMLIVGAIYCSFGAVGYWKYGDETQDSITLNLPSDEM